MLIGEKIKNIRELKNYTQEYIAFQLGITQSGYSKIEKGKTSLSLEKLEQLALILEVPLENIINFERNRYFNQNKCNDEQWSTDVRSKFELIKRLHDDKIVLLEKLIEKTDLELQFYKQNYGNL
ncbi:helix-turn-helix domain-containing protein [Flavobacterium sp. CLA17]|uniref:helix-turn-helix domain-containing protein n=1 Tax=Flavobacterium sp. CLA17 TaxID=2724135 RepID=UPI00149108D5|nr:helix-turn-helix transcriptional regulator [Flavobacterium sp. CLA17]QSB29190.1 helix-turn-helix transcriptional regulator [Flavobacterium sp. CLA17]